MSRHWPPITVRHVQTAMSLEGPAHAITRADIARALDVTDRELDLLLSEHRVLDVSAHAYLAEFDVDDAADRPGNCA
jgi:hypothetical protein